MYEKAFIGGSEKRLYSLPGAADAIRLEARTTISRLRACRRINSHQRDGLIAELESLLAGDNEPSNIRALDEADTKARKIVRYLEK